MITCFVQQFKAAFRFNPVGIYYREKADTQPFKTFPIKKCGYFIMDFFNLIGIPVHELGHLLFGLFFGYHIDQVCLYRTTKRAIHSGGTLGFVKMHHENHSFYKNCRRFRAVFIGIGPLLFGPAVIYIISRFLPENIRTLPFSFQKGWAISLKALQQLRASDIIFLFVFLYIIMGISLNMELSRQDMHLACKGLILLEVIFLILSGLSVLFHWNLQYSIDILFRWNLLISSIGIISALIANLISLI